MTPRRGVDSYRHLDGAAAAAAGLGFWMRYLGGSADKDLTAAEVADAHAHGIDVGLNFESQINDHTGGYPAGQLDATTANDQADALGAPPGAWIYYSIDTAATADEVRPYFQGIASIGRRPAAGYGGWEIHAMKAEGLCAGWWQANAGSWSGWSTSTFVTDPAADMRQLVDAFLPNTDGNVQYSTDCGLWLAQGEPPMTPAQAQQLAEIWQALQGADAKDPDGKPMGMHWTLVWIWYTVQKIAARLDAAPPGPAAPAGRLDAATVDAIAAQAATMVLAQLRAHPLTPAP